MSNILTNKAPKVTVVIPLYNTQRYIAEALDSVLSQTFTDFEVIVIDDQSTDNGPEITKDYISKDQRVRMISQKNRGLAGARNTGIRHARGEYIALLDADDSWHREKLERHVAQMDADDKIGVSFAPSMFMDDDGVSLGLIQGEQLTDITDIDIFCRNPVGNGSAAILRKAMLDEVSFDMKTAEGMRTAWFDESFRQSEDIEMWTRIATTTSWSFEGLAMPLTYYRVNSTGLSANLDAQYKTWKRFYEKMEEISPKLIKDAGKRAESYQCRYLARRAAVSGDGWQSLNYMISAFSLYPSIILEDYKKSLQTFVLGSVAAIIPKNLFIPLKNKIFTRISLKSSNSTSLT